ncbi:MAG: L-2-hydroxyglutarate oxidase [Deinococcales bacterium]
MDPARPDIAVLGGGIVGLATALSLQDRHPELQLTVLEKEPQVGRHQTGHNSGVVHSGIYYRPGTLKARLCVEGVGLLRAFCERHGIPYDPVGKVIVATRGEELARLDDLMARGTANGVPGLRMLDGEELREVEPHATGLRAIHSPSTAITDYGAVTRAMREAFEARGGRVLTGAQVRGIRSGPDGVQLDTGVGPVDAGHLITCGGLYADRVARLAGVDLDVRIIPFRGEYMVLAPERRELVRGLIYPVPDPTLPFLGVHLTRTVGGEVEAGPNAVLAFDREGYSVLDVSLRDTAESLSYPGLWRMAGRFIGVGLYEYYRSFSKVAFVHAIQRLLPDIDVKDVRRGGAGVRAQALGRDGKLLDDFVIRESERALHVLNAPSPAATASLAIGRHLSDLADERFGL